MSASVWVVIVNYRTPELAIDCLRAIATQRDDVRSLRVVVLDNASGDGSVEKLMEAIRREGWEGWVSFVANLANGGFACGANAGIKRALLAVPRVDYVLLLNPDTIPRPGSIRALVDFMDVHPHAGVAGSALENGDGGTQSSAHNAPSPLGELVAGASLGILSRVLHRHAVTLPTSDAPAQCDWVSGASLMVRRKVFESVGLLDEEYFLYFEEVDFCSRVRKAGWTVWSVPESRVVHFEGASTGIRQMARRRPGYWYVSRRRYFTKHFGTAGLLLADVLWAFGRLSLALRRVLRLGSGGSERTPAKYALDLIWGDLRSVFRRGDTKRRRDDLGVTP